MALSVWMFSEIFSAAILLVAGIYIYHKYFVFNFWRKRNLFYVEPTFPTGSMMPLLKGKYSFAEYFQAVYNDYKQHRMLGLYMMFKPVLVVCDPDLIQEVLVKEFTSFHDRGMYCNEKIDPLSGHLFMLPGKKWRNLRVKLIPTFTSGKLKQVFSILKESGDTLEKFLEDKAQARVSIDMKEILARFFTDIIMSVAFGVSCNSLENPDNEFRYYGKKVFEPRAIWNAIMIFLPQVYELFNLPFTERDVTKFFLKAFSDTVEYREKNNFTRKDFLNMLIQLMKDGYVEADNTEDNVDVSKKTENKLSMSEAAAQAYIFFLAGYETSSTTASFCLYELAMKQDIQDKVREEIHTVCKKHGGLTYNAINEMTYLHKTVSETLRKYPPVPVLTRITTRETVMPTTGVHLPKGVFVTIPIYGLHRDPAIYPDPENFDPERFSDENVAARHPFAYLPFGEGPRICIGARLGWAQVKVALVSMLSKYKFKLSPGMQKSISMEPGSLVISAQGGIYLTIEPI